MRPLTAATPTAPSPHPVVLLLERLGSAGIRYPEGVVPVAVDGAPPILGTAFFPGGYGLWRLDPAMSLDASPSPIGGVMWVGNNFGSEAYVAQRQRLGNTEVGDGHRVAPSATWRQLLPLIQAAGVDREGSFFTNAYMGLLKGSQRNVGTFPGTKPGSPFEEDCRAFMLKQVEVMLPSVVVALGTPARRFLGRVGDNQLWASSATFKDLDAMAGGRVTLQFDGRKVAGVALVHPSYGAVNLKARPRTYLGVQSPEAEAAMLRDSLRRGAR